MLNRREFIGDRSAVSSLASRATALPRRPVRWAMSSHMFTPLKPHPEAGIKMAARFGFHGIEPWANEMQQLSQAAAGGLQEGARRGRHRHFIGRERRRIFRHVEAAGHARQPRRERQVRRVFRHQGAQGQPQPPARAGEPQRRRTPGSSRRISTRSASARSNTASSSPFIRTPGRWSSARPKSR